MEQPNYFEYKGFRIYYTDYSGITNTDFFLKRTKVTKEKVEFFLQKGYKDLLLLNNVTDAFIGKEVIKELKEIAKMGRPVIKKSAVIGISLSKQIFLNIINKFSGFNMKAFATREEACEWLIKD